MREVTPLDVLSALARDPDDPNAAISLWEGASLPLTDAGKLDVSNLLVPLLGILHASLGLAAAGSSRAAVIEALREIFIEVEANRLQ